MTKTALITGASRGLGAALAKALAPEFHIIAVARTVGGLEELDDAIKAKGGSATLAPMDITKDDAMTQLCRSIHDRWGTLNVWAHTAIHAAPLSPGPHVDAKDFAKSMDVNVIATQRLITYVAPLLGDSDHAIFFDDPCSGEKFFSAYGASKAAQISLAYSWAGESAKTGPNVHVATPDPMPTATRARFYPGESRDGLRAPEDVAQDIVKVLG
jgi:NAD(P)-dependent dehydrogenase (short-subunit alcohol dehydrogenase family)